MIHGNSISFLNDIHPHGDLFQNFKAEHKKKNYFEKKLKSKKKYLLMASHYNVNAQIT